MMPAVDEYGDVVRTHLPTPADGSPGGGTGGSTVVDPEGLVGLANSVIHDLHADAVEARTQLRELAGGAFELGPDEQAQRMSAVVSEALQVYLAWSREIEELLLDVQDGMVAAAREYTGADDASAAELRRRSTDVFTDHVHVPVDADGDGRLDAVEDTGLDARDGHDERSGGQGQGEERGDRQHGGRHREGGR